MKTKTFIKAGKAQDNDKVFFTNNSVYKNGGTIYHRNDFSTIYNIPWDFYQKHFKFDYSCYIYRCKLTYNDLKQFAKEIKH